MKLENKKPILSKRIVICLVIASFLIIAAIFVAIISTEGDSSPSDTTPNEPNLDNNKENASETEENGFENFFELIDNIPFWVLIGAGIIGFWMINKRHW